MAISACYLLMPVELNLPARTESLTRYLYLRLSAQDWIYWLHLDFDQQHLLMYTAQLPDQPSLQDFEKLYAHYK